MTQLLRLTGSVSLQAAADGNGELLIVAYGGGTMRIGGWGNVAIDFAGLQMPKTVPILAAHENTLDALAGQGVPKIHGGELVVRAKLAPGPAGDRVRELLEAGVNLQASVGVVPTKTSYSRDGGVKVNGREVPAGTTIGHAATLREVSILPVGADGSTSVSIAATAAEEVPMNFTDWLASLNIQATDANRGQLEATHARLYPPPEKPASGAELEAALKDTPLLARAMSEAWTLGRANEEKLRYIRASRPSPSIGNATPGSKGVASDPLHTMEAALLVRCGYEKLAEQHYGGQVLEASRPMHRASITEVIACTLRASGVDPGPRRDLDGMMQAAASTAAIPVILSNVANKILEKTWAEAPATWRSFAMVKTAGDFKQQTSLKPTFLGNLQQTGPDGEIKNSTLGEFYFNWQVYQFARQVNITRMTLVNDDLSALTDSVPSYGRAAARTLNDLVYAVLLGNAGAFFAAGNKNYQSGGGSPLSASSLSTAVKQLRTQTNPEGGYLDLTPAALVVPAALETTARELLNSDWYLRDQSDDRQPTGNAFKGLSNLEVEPRLDNGVVNPIGNAPVAGSATGWYLFSQPANLAMVVGFLNGQQAPIIQVFPWETNQSSLAMTVRCISDFGAALGDFRAAQKSAGA